MTQRSWILMLVALFAMLLMACGSTETDTAADDEVVVEDDDAVVEDDTDAIVADDDADNVVVDADPTACNVAAPADATEINMLGWSFPITDFYAEELEKCDDIENININTQLLAAADAREQARLVLSSEGDSYDIVHGANGEIADWGGSGWLMPLNDLIDQYRDEYNLDDIPQAAWDGATFDGQIYGVPIVANTLHFIYNADVYDELGLDVPETYDDVIANCEAIGLDNSDYDAPFTVNLSAGWAWEIEFFQMLRAYGGDYIDDGGNAAFNGEEGVQAVERLVEIADACMGETGYVLSLDDQEVAIQQGFLPASNMWASRAANMSDPERSGDLAEVISYAPAPRAEEGLPRVGSAWNDYYMIPAGAANDPELVFQIIMEAADEASQREAAAVGMPTRTTVADAGGPYVSAANTTIEEGIGIYQKDPAIAIVRSTLGEFLPLVGTGELTAQEALDQAAEAYTEEAEAQGLIDS